MCNFYTVAIQKINSANNAVDEIPPTNFSVVDHKINGSALEILIQYKSQGNPGVLAFWDEKNDKFYVVGGKTDAPVERKIAGFGFSSFTLAKTNQAWISIDLSQLGKKGEVNIWERTCAKFNLDTYEKTEDPSDNILMKVFLSN